MFVLQLADKGVGIGEDRNSFTNSSASLCCHIRGAGVGSVVVVLLGVIVYLGDLVVWDIGFLDGENVAGKGGGLVKVEGEATEVPGGDVDVVLVGCCCGVGLFGVVVVLLCLWWWLGLVVV